MTVDDRPRTDEYVSRIMQLDHLIRGCTLNHSTVIEHSMGRIIAYHFQMDKERRNLFFSLIMNDPSMTYSRKMSILRDLLKISYPEILGRNKELVKDLRKVMEWRNRISHCNTLVTEEIRAKGDIKRVYYSHYIKDERKEFSISINDFQERLFLMSSVIGRLKDIEREVMEINGIVDDDPRGKVESALMVTVLN